MGRIEAEFGSDHWSIKTNGYVKYLKKKNYISTYIIKALFIMFFYTVLLKFNFLKFDCTTWIINGIVINCKVVTTSYKN